MKALRFDLQLLDSCLRHGARLPAGSLLQYSEFFVVVRELSHALPEPMNFIVEQRLRGQTLIEISRSLSLPHDGVEVYLERAVRLLEQQLTGPSAGGRPVDFGIPSVPQSNHSNNRFDRSARE